MAVFFNHPIQPAGLDSTNLVHHEVEWHGKFALLAVASKNETTDADGSVNFYLDEGEVLEDASIHRSTVVECMQWHQEKKLMSIGWRSGEVTTYNDHDHEFFEQSSIHRSPIRVLRWNQSGTQLLSGDKSGLLVVWKVDSRGQLHPSPLHQHRLQAPITHCTMLHPPSSPSYLGLSLPGDRSVLDAFSWQRKSMAMNTQASLDSIACFCATADGTVYYIGHVGECVERFHVEGPVHSLLLHNERQVMAVVTQDMVFSQFSVNSEGQTTQTMKAKLSGKNKATSIIWVTEGVLASCSNESVIRFWDFDRGDNYVLDVQQHALITDEVITSISYDSDKGMLAGGTSAGNVVIWRWKGATPSPSSSSFSPGGSSEGPDRWEYLTSSMVAGPVTEVKWGAKKSLLAVNSGSSVEILTEHVLNAHFNQQVSAVQVSPSEVLVECHSTGVTFSIKSDIHIRGIYVTKEHVALWSGKKFVVYNISQEKTLVRVAGSFASEAQIAALYELNVYTAEKNQIHVRTCQGTVKQLLTCSEQEGSPIVLGVSGHFLVAGTNTGYVKMWDLGRREAKVQCSKQLLAKSVLESSQVVLVSCNCFGSRISIITQQTIPSLIPRLFPPPVFCEKLGPNGTNWLLLWNIETDVVRVFNPATFHTQNDSPPISDNSTINMPLPELADASLSEQLGLSVELLGRHPVSHFWDPGEPRLLAVEFTAPGGEVRGGRTKGGKGGQLAQMDRSRKYPQAETVVVSLFVTQELSVLISDITPVDSTMNSLIGIHIPFLYFSKKAIMSSGHQRPSSPSPSPPGATVARMTLRDFVGLEQSDLSTLQAMVEFSYHSTVGNMDEAFKSIKLIKSESVWENMARMCVKTQRLDVAAICLGNMGNARAAKAVREAQSIVEPEARLAVLAVQLGMLDEAEELYKKSQRYDLLNQFYRALGQWSKAIEVAESHDRMHLKTTYYAYAKHAEALGEYPAAISSYEKSETHRFEVPRMLLDDPLELENYVMKSKDRGIRKWWAEYLESMGELEQAIQFYETAKDYYSLVRLLCFTGNLERAVEVVEESGSKVAAYQLARRLSMENEVKKAIHFYTKAQCYNPAIQLAKEHGLENELLNLALLSTREDKREAAKYYEANPETLEKAIMLYHKAGEVSKALDLCFLHQQFDVLHQIAEDLEGETSPEMAGRVAEYFQQHGQFEKAAELLIQSGRFREALDLCMTNNITITEELAERMTVAKTPNESPVEAERRVQVLEYLAECCVTQGSYHLATKKYTQAGNKTKAMKALLKSGDTEKIVFFAGVSRQKDIYVMAANYLQSLDWQRDAEIMKNIISFYTKGRALESLAGFYDACAQVEIDEFQNYAKALGALNEALKCLGKAKPKNQTTHEAKMNFMKERIDLVQRFADARRIYESDPEVCIHQCQSLLDEPHLDTAVRVGDIYGLMIEHYAQGGKYKQAYSLMEEMRQRIPTVNMVYYVNIRTLEAVHSALGIPLGRGIGADVQHGSGMVSGDARGEEEEEESDGEESVGEEVEEGY